MPACGAFGCKNPIEGKFYRERWNCTNPGRDLIADVETPTEEIEDLFIVDSDDAGNIEYEELTVCPWKLVKEFPHLNGVVRISNHYDSQMGYHGNDLSQWPNRSLRALEVYQGEINYLKKKHLDEDKPPDK